MEVERQPDIPPVPRPPWRKPKWWLAAGVVLALVAAAVVVPTVLRSAGRCADGVTRTDTGECVGVTDGSYVFAPELAEIQGLVRAENEAVVASGEPFVSIALMIPMTLTDNDTTPVEWVRHHLQGAYVAQYRANHDVATGDRPLIRLLLANPGSGLARWQPVVAELERRRTTSDHLVAVTGIGLSLATSRDAMVRLSEAKIPLFASTLTSDDLRDIDGLVNMAPTNAAQARAAATHVKANTRTAMLIQDDTEDELYAKTLAESFSTTFVDVDHSFAGQTEFFDSRLGGVANTFLQMVPNICTARPGVLYFAGRGQHLLMLVAQLVERKCKDHPIRILTGDDLSVVAFPGDLARRAADAGIDVRFTALAHPDAWRAAPAEFDAQSTYYLRDQICTVCFPLLFRNDTLDDASAIMAYDAVLTAVRTTRFAGKPPGRLVSPEDLLQVQNRLHGENAVPGASGWLSFDGHGSPIAKVVPIMRVQPDGTAGFADIARS
ncbi:ABC-type branched-subunit amino acid transport system substrate-binding protein [Saccharothrix carnea]|uniref:ABC-type branched-subunit amino acid transport system substrate-binding protein n=1 Tax=Saccharothrix carnea TaxID=1280637 RepID=A0A2P8I1D4_SACCR|nr:ABC transporter substrate-binding protein [Saccharothrix carnea]PSL52276.1 ABC-type branched-subunit amino acid transport system substrate-binding protein [Saccharothrix carnea]